MTIFYFLIFSKFLFTFVELYDIIIIYQIFLRTVTAMALFTPKKKNSLSQNTLTIVILVLFAVVTAAMCIGGLTMFKEQPIEDGSAADPAAFDTSKVYDFDEIVIIDEYAFAYEGSESNVTEHYYLIGFSNEDGEVYFASLEAKKDADIVDACNEYIADDTMEIGDLILKGVCICNELSAKEKDVRSEYANIIELYSEIVPGKDTGINFIYEAADIETYREDAKTDAAVLSIIGGVFALLCALGIFLCIRQRKAIKAELARAAALSANAEEVPVKTEATLNE